MNKLQQRQYWKSNYAAYLMHQKHHTSVNVIKNYSFHYFLGKYQPDITLWCTFTCDKPSSHFSAKLEIQQASHKTWVFFQSIIGSVQLPNSTEQILAHPNSVLLWQEETVWVVQLILKHKTLYGFRKCLYVHKGILLFSSYTLYTGMETHTAAEENPALDFLNPNMMPVPEHTCCLWHTPRQTDIFGFQYGFQCCLLQDPSTQNAQHTAG